MTGSLSHTRGRPERGVAMLPGFEASLRLLVEEERYSQHDIAMMFGVSRERIRQLCARYEVQSPDNFLGLRAMRVWDDATNRFRPTSRGGFSRQAKRTRIALRRAEIHARSAAQSAAVVRTIIELTQRLHREPSWGEMYVALFGDLVPAPPSSYAANVLRVFDSRSTNTAATLRAFRRATGTAGRPPGGKGHLRGRSPVCGICGTTWRVSPSGTRWCPERDRNPFHLQRRAALAALSPADDGGAR